MEIPSHPGIRALSAAVHPGVEEDPTPTRTARLRLARRATRRCRVTTG
jgi:hypothetical protein